MQRRELLFFFLNFLSLSTPLVLAHSQIFLPDEDGRAKTYIVHVRKPNSLVLRSAGERENWHRSFLPSHTLDSGESRLVYSYEHAIGGFAAILTPSEAEALEATAGVLSVQPDIELEPRTTYSPEFLGLMRTGQLWEKSYAGQGIVIGVLELAFNSSHASFSDDGMMPPPRSWRGSCDIHPEHCNKKLIGNKIFYNPSRPYNPRPDRIIHGTHVASIAAGNRVIGASFRGEASGTAFGAAPLAHLAFYAGRSMSDLLKAVDTAIEDGIDVLSISVGFNGGWDFYLNPLDTASLSATEHGIFVSAAVGNRGSDPYTLDDNTPWTLSVGASTMDRVTRVQIRLGNGDVILGETVNARREFFRAGASLPAVALGNNPTSIWDVHSCEAGKIEEMNVTGKAVLCIAGGLTNPRADPMPRTCKVDAAGGKAMIFLNYPHDGSTVIYSFHCTIPTVTVNYEDAERLMSYLASDPIPTLSFEPMGTVIGVRGHPTVASFSARGPSNVNNMVLKPDVLGPGVNILAANALTPAGFFYNSGTSMACPHLSGIAAMLRSLHPTWSPAMIKSAIMTTADWQDDSGMPIADERGKPASLHATGAGQVNGTRAADPGLVYDIQYHDYVKYVCGLKKYTPEYVERVVRKPVNCGVIGAISGEELNYPSFYVEATFQRKVITRTLMNVGRPRETYLLSLNQPRGVRIYVFPRALHFQYLRQNLTYKVRVTSMNPSSGGLEEGHLAWVSPYHTVRSPIAISFA